MTGAALADTPVQLAQCNRCQKWIFLAQSGGLRAAADPAPATREAYIEALTEGRRTFRLATQAGRPRKLLTRRLSDSPPTFDLAGAQAPAQDSLAVLVEHGCGANARNAVKFTPVDEAPPRTVCETWQAQGWVPPPRKCGREQNPMVTSCVTCEKPPFDLGLACGECGKPIMPGQEFWGIQHGEEWVYAAHIEDLRASEGSRAPSHPQGAQPASDPDCLSEMEHV